MTITFPRDMPAGLAAVSFEVAYSQVTALSGGGQPQVANVGVDVWRAAYRTTSLGERDGAAFEAWLHSLNGGAKLFRARHPLRKYGIAYPGGYAGMTKAGGGSFAAGTGTLNAVSTLRDEVTIGGLPASYQFRAGDYLSWGFGSARQAFHRCLDDVTANASGVATFGVFPLVVPGWTAGAAVALQDPYFLAVLDAKSVTSTWQRGRRVACSFEAGQVV